MENLNYLKIYVDRLYILMRTFDHDLLIEIHWQGSWSDSILELLYSTRFLKMYYNQRTADGSGDNYI